MTFRNRCHGAPHSHCVSRILAAVLLFPTAVLAASALPVIVEQEPNDTPDEASLFSAPAVLSGAMTSSDQDGYTWRISDADALERWTLTLHGIPDALTGVGVFRVQRGPDPNSQSETPAVVITGADKLLSFGIRDGSRPVSKRDLLLPSGDYLVGVFRGGGSSSFTLPDAGQAFDSAVSTAGDETAPPDAYRVFIEKGAAKGSLVTAQHNSKEQAYRLRHGSTIDTVASGETWYRFSINDQNAASVWTVRGSVTLGRTLKVTLQDASGDTLTSASTDRYGQYELPNLTLAPGDYYVTLADPADGLAVRTVIVTATGATIDGGEAEPNDTWNRSNRVSVDTTIAGNIDKSRESDYYEFVIDDEQTGQPFDLRFASDGITSVRLCLLGANGSPRQCRIGKPPVVLPGLSLETGRHGISVSRVTETAPYTIERVAAAAQSGQFELEPNDQATDASLIGSKGILRGTLPAGDTDYFTLYVTDAPQLWRLQAIGADLHELGYHPLHGDGAQKVRAGGGVRRLRLDNLFLLPGTHRFSLTGRAATKYTLRAMPLGPPDAHAEREPNGDRNHANDIPLDGHVVGMLSGPGYDYYRFHIAARQFVRLELHSPPDAQLRMNLYWDGGQIKQFFPPAGKGFAETLELLPGDYYAHVSAYQPSDAEYELHVKATQPAGGSESEPNDTVHFADDWPGNWILEGTLGVSRAGADWYALPKLAVAQAVSIEGLEHAGLQFVDAKRKRVAEIATSETGDRIVTLPADTDVYAYVHGSGAYRYELHPEDGSLKASAAENPLAVDIAIDPVPAAAAYRTEQQALATQISITNREAEPLALLVVATTTDPTWTAQIAAANVTLQPGATRAVPVEVLVGADAWPDHPVRLLVTVADGEGATARADAALEARRGVPPSRSARFHPLPAMLEGSVNVASAALGARWLSTIDEQDSLNDGITPLGYYFSSRRSAGNLPAAAEPTLQLAGSTPVDVIGFSFVPFGLQDGQPAARNASEVEVALSMDAEQWSTVLKVPLTAHTVEQAFALDRPQPARYARLRLLDSYDDIVTLGEWKVLATADSAGSVLPANIAAPELGGHVVYARPNTPTFSHDLPMITTGDAATAVRLWADARPAFVIGFNHNRAALIDGVRWQQAAGGTKFESVTVHASLESPLGPWTELGSFTPTEGTNGLDLDESVWARFVRFELHSSISNGASVSLPETVEVLENRDDVRRSVLAEWGHQRTAAAYEAMVTTPQAAVDGSEPANTSRAKAQQLTADAPADGLVRLGHYSNWYRLVVPDGHNTVALTLRGAPGVGVTPTLHGPDKEIALQLIDSAADQNRFEARVAPGTYYLEVKEPPRSVVFTWDTSGSTNAMRPVMRQALMRYVADVKPGLDEAQMLPFGGDFLSRQWLDQPYMLQTVLNDYNGAGDSSAAETALVRAAEKLRTRDGQKFIVVLTDAATSKDGALWGTLDQVRPTIIALGVSSRGAFSSNPRREQDLMQDWAASSNGYYEYVENVGSLARAFDRASSRIRQPVAYTIEFASRYEDPPRPGQLQVVSALAGAVDAGVDLPAPVIEVILDASGSMLQRIGDKRRYQVAQTVLTDLVQNRLPDNVRFGFRVFGHREPGSCRTDLEMPIAALDRAAAVKLIGSITPKNLAKTPIAASLAAAATDLAGVDGERTILLITDGEETCEGDVEAAIRSLRDSGLDTVVNIVGFAIDDDALDATFRRWAASGGGDYYRAADDASLARSVARAAARPFQVLDAAGELVGEGFSDGPVIDLPAGTYRLVFGRNAGGSQRDLTVTIEAAKTRRVGVQ